MKDKMSLKGNLQLAETNPGIGKKNHQNCLQNKTKYSSVSLDYQILFN